MSESLTAVQKQRLTELNAKGGVFDQVFATTQERDAFFKASERELIKQNKDKIHALLNETRRPLMCRIEETLAKWLTDRCLFTRVVTPIIIPEVKLSKMSISAGHPLTNQVFWLEGGKKCLRPMLAPNLYEMMRDLYKLEKQPVKIFECGPCFRKESQGAQHMNEFTMLNLVEYASVNDGGQMARLQELAAGAMGVLGITDYQLEAEKSEVYGETLDIIINGAEVASGAYGPHPLDSEWGIFDTWVGIGFGIERLTMAAGDYQNIKRVGRSVSYLDGARLNI